MKIGVQGKEKFNSISKKYNLILVVKEYSQAVKINFRCYKNNIYQVLLIVCGNNFWTCIKLLLYVGINFDWGIGYGNEKTWIGLLCEGWNFKKKPFMLYVTYLNKAFTLDS